MRRGPPPSAEAWLQAELQGACEGRPTLPSKIKVAELLDEWLAVRSVALKPNTHREYERIAEPRINPRLGDYKVTVLRPGHIARMLHELRQPGANRRGKGGDRVLSETSL